MSTLKKCDVCGKEFDFGFTVGISFVGDMSFTDIAEHRFELGIKDICMDCYYSAKSILESQLKNN